MAVWGEVSFKVRRTVLLAGKFTVSQIEDITGIKYQSVETVIQRLLKEGTLVKADAKKDISSVGVVSKKGRPKQYYTFAGDEKIKMLKENLEALSLEHSMAGPVRHKPKNPHFVKAISLINDLESSSSAINENVLNEIENNLSLSKEYEDAFDENNEIALAHIDFAKARLEYLKDDRDEAEKLLITAKDVFKKFEMKEEQSADEYFVSSALKAAVHEIKKTLKHANFETLSDKLNRLFLSFSSCSAFPVIFTKVKEFAEIVGKLSELTATLNSKNRTLENQIYLLLEENYRLKIQNQLSTEINHNLSEVVKITSAQEI